MVLRDHVSAIDELATATERLRVQLPDEPKPSPPVLHIIELHEIPPVDVSAVCEEPLTFSEEPDCINTPGGIIMIQGLSFLSPRWERSAGPFCFHHLSSQYWAPTIGPPLLRPLLSAFHTLGPCNQPTLPQAPAIGPPRIGPPPSVLPCKWITSPLAPQSWALTISHLHPLALPTLGPNHQPFPPLAPPFNLPLLGPLHHGPPLLVRHTTSPRHKPSMGPYHRPPISHLQPLAHPTLDPHHQPFPPLAPPFNPPVLGPLHHSTPPLALAYIFLHSVHLQWAICIISRLISFLFFLLTWFLIF
ncbi:hypothetical protein XELAEV_18026752mg [Xenopus laevis]|uniref:Uncharacterized protein n=1 Tax=Xenopus laevis TaxID=8355 RepID=A0A974HJ12_XENLA|nr:hypothetical protein XELAEV_18026752mg [Xenopus laevis]